MTENEFRNILKQKAKEFAISNGTTEEEIKKLAKAYVQGASDYAYLTLEDCGISQEEYQAMHDTYEQLKSFMP